MASGGVQSLARKSASSVAPDESSPSALRNTGRLIINADDWGRDEATTDRTFDCTTMRTVSSVSAMVFMADSERAASIARESGIDAGLHLNFTELFSASSCSVSLLDRQGELKKRMGGHSLARTLYYPGLAASFEYVVAAQIDEYRRLYGVDPQRIDGHHHLHLCMNVVLGELLPADIVVRRNFSFLPGEKSLLNRLYRRIVDGRLAARHRVVDFLFNLLPLRPEARLQRIFALSRNSVVELETHPINSEEHRFLTSGEIVDKLGDLPISRSFTADLNESYFGTAACQ
jgi:chitin disaccharide deacetylase